MHFSRRQTKAQGCVDDAYYFIILHMKPRSATISTVFMYTYFLVINITRIYTCINLLLHITCLYPR